MRFAKAFRIFRSQPPALPADFQDLPGLRPEDQAPKRLSAWPAFWPMPGIGFMVLFAIGNMAVWQFLPGLFAFLFINLPVALTLLQYTALLFHQRQKTLDRVDFYHRIAAKPYGEKRLLTEMAWVAHQAAHIGIGPKQFSSRADAGHLVHVKVLSPNRRQLHVIYQNAQTATIVADAYLQADDDRFWYQMSHQPDISRQRLQVAHSYMCGGLAEANKWLASQAGQTPAIPDERPQPARGALTGAEQLRHFLPVVARDSLTQPLVGKIESAIRVLEQGGDERPFWTLLDYILPRLEEIIDLHQAMPGGGEKEAVHQAVAQCQTALIEATDAAMAATRLDIRIKTAGILAAVSSKPAV